MKVQRILCPINEKGQWDEPDGNKRFIEIKKVKITQEIGEQKNVIEYEAAEYIIPVQENATSATPKDKQ
jgi:hypothetical protein